MIYLVRHGETEWSRRQRHTGRSDIPLDVAGETKAKALVPALAAIAPIAAWSSPLRRARETCALALPDSEPTIDARLLEWDYGDAEGRTTNEIRNEIPGWSVWTNEITGGESLDELGARADSVVADLRQFDGDLILFGHAHFFRVLGARWCDLPAAAGGNLRLDPASLSVLGYERDTPTINRWNWLSQP